MILYFSGTGNSKAVAKSLGDKLSEDARMILDVSPLELSYQGNMLGIVFPVYSWGVPPLILDYIRILNSRFLVDARKHPLFMICVCGDETALAPEMLKRVLKEKGLPFRGGWSVLMPNNYVLLPGFDVDSAEVEQKKLSDSSQRIGDIASKIKAGDWEEDYVRGDMQWIKSKLIYPLFKHWGIFPDRWHHTEVCVSCGKCVKACPMHNIKLENGYPQWGKNCVSCLACYHSCPRHAVEYANITKKKGQYFHP